MAQAAFVVALTVGASGCVHAADPGTCSQQRGQHIGRTVASDPDVCRVGGRQARLGEVQGHGQAHEYGRVQGYLTSLEKLREEVRARLDVGEATAADLAQVDARLAGARARLARARADLAIARAELTAVTGRHRPCASIP
jgi:hypothetical protein